MLRSLSTYISENLKFFLLLVALTCLLHALALNHAVYAPWPLALVIISTVTLVVFTRLRGRRLSPYVEGGACLLLLAEVLRQMHLLVSHDAILRVEVPVLFGVDSFMLLRYLISTAAFLFTVTTFLPERFLKIGFVLLILIFLATGAWTLLASPHPGIDVFVSQKLSAGRLLLGLNPYGGTMPNIYSTTEFFGEGVVVDGRVQLGYPYLPLALYLESMSSFVFFDPRAIKVLAVAGSACFIFFAARSRIAFLVAALLLFQYTSFYVIDQAWTEPLSLFFFSMIAFAWQLRKKNLLLVALALFVATKQYNFLLVPLFAVTFRREISAAQWGSVALMAVGLTLPMVLWDVRAFFHDTVQFQALQPFRRDALSISAGIFDLTGYAMPSVVGFVALAFALVYCLKNTADEKISTLSVNLALCLLCFFIFNKQAFCNYYYLIVGVLCVGLASAFSEETRRV